MFCLLIEIYWSLDEAIMKQYTGLVDAVNKQVLRFCCRIIRIQPPSPSQLLRQCSSLSIFCYFYLYCNCVLPLPAAKCIVPDWGE
jgi:hypothetical protein